LEEEDIQSKMLLEHGHMKPQFYVDRSWNPVNNLSRELNTMYLLFCTALPYNDFFEYYGPDFRLDVPMNNMLDFNNRDYLDKVKIEIIENLRGIPFAPSVQMQGKCLGACGFKPVHPLTFFVLRCST
jgi:hypothetical protein